ncbi:alpha/beta fold hydrolase [Saccharomonospora piscinae]|uniref:alpha/beta fold hydrolase n=1 Tax=Saccharomonospora piscinae TaxID=687388 RepID=UPI001105A9BE|nr:alpha/beta fold hydrolase [Saccharomonospora piscinae]TLW91096.1 alpha/beta fold hydrolase [Saccharomonospora piscinae]
MPSIALPGVTLGYADDGDGPPVVLLHGHPFDRTMWRPQIQRLVREGYRVVTPDLRGYGASPLTPPVPVTTFERHVLDLTALIDHLGLDRFVLGGLSMGGQLALECYRHLGDRLDGLVLAATSARADSPEVRAQRLALADALPQDGIDGHAAALGARLLAEDSARALPSTVKHVWRMMRHTSPEGAAAALRGRAQRDDHVDLLGRIAVPTLVVVGTDDVLTPVPEAELLAERIPAATLAVLDGVGHLPNLENEVGFDDRLVAFLREHAHSQYHCGRNQPTDTPCDTRHRSR